jgi:hypothetical protein
VYYTLKFLIIMLVNDKCDAVMLRRFKKNILEQNIKMHEYEAVFPLKSHVLIF